MWYLKHELHGKKIAYMKDELTDDLKRGWKEYDPEEEYKLMLKEQEKKYGVQKDEETTEEEVDINTIKAELDELGIKYRKNSTPEKLMELLENGRSNAN